MNRIEQNRKTNHTGDTPVRDNEFENLPEIEDGYEEIYHDSETFINKVSQHVEELADDDDIGPSGELRRT